MKPYLFLSILLFAVACSVPEPNSDTTSTDHPQTAEQVVFTPDQLKTAGIVTGTPETRTVSTLINVNGMVDVPPQNHVSVCFPSGGYLLSTQLLPGMKVHKGQVIAVMQDQAYVDLQQDYLVALAGLQKLTRDYERQKNLNADKSTSDKVFEQVEAEYNSQKAMVNALKQKLLLIGIAPDRLTADNISRSVNVLSPIDGYVSAVHVNAGQYLAPTDILFELVNPENMHVALTVFGKDLPYIVAGQKVHVQLVSDPDNTFSAEIVYVGKQIDPNNSTEIHCELLGDVKNVLPGMFVKAQIETQAMEKLCVPEDAVVRMKESEYVFVQQAPQQFQRVKVTTGQSENQWIPIESSAIPLEGRQIITVNAWSALMMLENTSE